MHYTRFIRWVLANMDQAPSAIKHAQEVWGAIQSGNGANAAREAGEFLIWLSAILETMPEFAGEEVAIADYQAIEEAGISIGGLMQLWTLIQLLLPLFERVQLPPPPQPETP